MRTADTRGGFRWPTITAIHTKRGKGGGEEDGGGKKEKGGAIFLVRAKKKRTREGWL